MKEKEQEKEKNNRKRQLLLALFMLIVSSITLTTASYAWFTANTNVSIETLDVNVGATNGIQISTDAVTWKAAITSTDIINNAYVGNVNQMPTNISPTSTAGNVTTADGDSKGRMEIFSGEINWDETAANYMLTAPEQLTDTAGNGAAAGKYIAFDVFFSVQEDTDLYLTNTSSVLATANDVGVRNDTGLKNAARVAFLNEGYVAAGNSEGAIALNGATAAIIWEPNNDVHTSAAVDWNTTVYKTTIDTDDTLSSYYGVKAVISSANAIPHGSTPATAPDYLETVTPNISTPTTMTEYKKVTTLHAGINKIRIYAWVEGQDIDCENNASGSDISFTLKFSKNSAAA